MGSVLFAAIQREGIHVGLCGIHRARGVPVVAIAKTGQFLPHVRVQTRYHAGKLYTLWHM